MATDAHGRRRHVLLTGFGPFGEVTFNPSGEVARAISEQPPAGWRVTHALLPVTFEGAPRAIDACLSAIDASLDLIVGLGVHPGHAFRVERRARTQWWLSRPDNAGAVFVGDPTAAERVATWDPDQVAAGLQRAGAGAVVVSDDAGQYVCERTFHHLLMCAHTLRVAAVFVHVPPEHSVPWRMQAEVLRAWLGGLESPTG